MNIEKASKKWDNESSSYVCSNCGKHVGVVNDSCPHCHLVFSDNPESDENNKQSQYIALGFNEAVRICFKKYANINGRGSRSEYWWFLLFGMLSSIFLQILDLIYFEEYYGQFGEANGPFSLLGILALTIPGFTAYVRRLHDTNRSGWNQLWALTIIGVIPLMIWICTEGDDGKNKYGKNPLKKRNIKKGPKPKEKNTEKIEKPTHAKTKVDKSTLAEKSKDKKELPKTDADEIADELKKYKQMLSDGLITQADYNAKKKNILGI